MRVAAAFLPTRVQLCRIAFWFITPPFFTVEEHTHSEASTTRHLLTASLSEILRQRAEASIKACAAIAHSSETRGIRRWGVPWRIDRLQTHRQYRPTRWRAICVR